MPYTLLLADDSVTIQRVIELTFADEDVQVVAVSDGDRAVERLESSPPDIVLADVGMPGRNGYEVARYVKQSQKLSHIPVVLLTGAFEPVDQARATEVGADGVLAKPFEPQLVISRVKELLTGQRKTAALGEGRRDAPTPQPTVADLDDYFDRLDVAFSNLTNAATPNTVFAASLPEPPTGREIDDFASETSAPEIPHTYNAPRPAVEASTASPPADAPQQTPATPPKTELPSIADAFAAILAAEQGAPPPLARPAWPSPANTPADPSTSADLVDRVTRQVLERLSDRVVREQVVDIVSAVAERLVREEIERIKSSIK